MTIGIAIQNLYPGKIGGSEQYIRNLISAWEQSEDIKLVLFLNEQAMDSFAHVAGNVCRVCVPYQLVDVRGYYEYYIAKYDIQVLFCPLFYVPYENSSVPVISTIHDIQYEYFPENFTPDILEYRRKETQKTIDNSSKIITISDFSKKTLIERLAVNEEKIEVIYEDAHHSFYAKIDAERNAKIKEKLPERYIFYPANGWPHKNHKKLIDAFQILRDKYHTKYRLVLTGNAFNDENKLEEYIMAKGLQDEVLRLGYIEQQDMPYVFHNAEIMVFPSLFEGFGIPLVEAMRAGVPIACSGCGSIPEVAGDAALLFDGYDAEDIAAKVHELEDDAALRDELRRRGYSRAESFSWKNCAEKTLAVLDRQRKKRWRYKAGAIPQALVVIPSVNDWESFKASLTSIDRQAYPYKKIIAACVDKQRVKEIKQKLRNDHLAACVVSWGSLATVLKYMCRRDRNGFVELIQCGQVFAAEDALEQSILEGMCYSENVVMQLPMTDGFWGAVFRYPYPSKEYEKYIQMDKASTAAVMLRGSQRQLLFGIKCWFDGHYQEVLLAQACMQEIDVRYSESELIQSQKERISGHGKRYLRSLEQISLTNQYVPSELIDDDDPEQRKIAGKLAGQSKTVGCYYAQIQRKALEFDGICADGWMSRKCEMPIEIKKTGSRLCIAGENIALAGGPVLTISLDQMELTRQDLNELGEFEAQADIPDTVAPGSHSICLEMSDVTAASQEDFSDIRALSIRIKRIAVDGQDIWTLA